MKKLQFPVKNKKLILVLVVGIVLVAAGLFFLRPQNNLSEEEKRLVADTKKTIEAGATEQTLNTATIQEIQSSIASEENQKAKEQLETLLENENDLAPAEKYSTYTALAQVCLALADLDCVERVVKFQQKEQLLDYFFIVEAARLADKNNDSEKATMFYSIVYEEIEKLGGEDYVGDINLQSQATLDYQEIKKGAER